MPARVPHQVIEGGADIDTFLDALARIDLVVGIDGGTAHLCSLRKPIVSVFGSSPWRPNVPFHISNELLTRDEPGWPSVQFSAIEVNGRMTRGRTALWRPRQVEQVVLSKGTDIPGVSGVRVERGVCHRAVA